MEKGWGERAFLYKYYYYIKRSGQIRRKDRKGTRAGGGHTAKEEKGGEVRLQEMRGEENINNI